MGNEGFIAVASRSCSKKLAKKIRVIATSSKLKSTVIKGDLD